MKKKILKILNDYLGFYQEQLDDANVLGETYVWNSPELMDFIATLHEKVNEIKEVIKEYEKS